MNVFASPRSEHLFFMKPYYAVIDFETTGAGDGLKPVEFACVLMSAEGDILEHWEVFVDTQRQGHGVAVKRFADSLPMEQVESFSDTWPKISEMLDGNIVVGHSCGVDRLVLNSEFPLLEINSWLDTLDIYRKLYGRQIPDYSLQYLLDTFQLTEELKSMKLNKHFFAHRALYDTMGCALLLRRLLQDDEIKAWLQTPRQEELF